MFVEDDTGETLDGGFEDMCAWGAAERQGNLLSYEINQDNVSINDLGSRLSAIFSLRANKAMCIKADDNLDFSTVALVLDIGKGAGADHVGLITSKGRL